MPGVFSTMRNSDDTNIHDLPSQTNNYSAIGETKVFESSSYESNYSSESDDLNSTEYLETTAEEIEATAFLNQVLKNQSQKDGDFKRIESMLVIITIFITNYYFYYY